LAPTLVFSALYKNTGANPRNTHIKNNKLKHLSTSRNGETARKAKRLAPEDASSSHLTNLTAPGDT
jgi:hypothetical protein